MIDAGRADESEAEEAFFYLLFQALRRRDAAFGRALAALDLDLSKWRSLSVVRRLSGCTMNELAEFTTIDRTTLTRTTDQLAAAGLVERQGSPGDRRRVCLVCTPAGEAAFDQAMAIMHRFNAQALRDVDEAEAQALKATLGKVLRNITGSPEQAQAIVDFRRV